MPLFDDVRLQLSDHLFGSALSPSPSTWWVGLVTELPNADGTNLVEVTGNGYGRVEVAKTTGWTSAVTTGEGDTSTEVENAATVTFPTATGGGWGSAVAFVLFDAETAGNPLAFGQLTVPVEVLENDAPFFPPAELRVVQT